MGLSYLPPVTPEEGQLRESTREIVRRLILPTIVEDDAVSHFRRSTFDALGKAGLVAVAAPARWGGGGTSYRSYYACLEEISRGSLAMAVTVGVTNLLIGGLLAFGDEEQKQRFATPLCRGELLGAFSLSEAQSGSDAAGLRCAARRVDGGYRITGAKSWCSSAGHADVYLVMARTAESKTKGITAFIVPKETTGFHVGKQENKLGLRTSSLAELVFEDAFLPDSMRLGKDGDGFAVALSQLDAGRITIGTGGLGTAMEAIERTWRYLEWREAEYGVPFEEATQQGLAEYYAVAQAVKSLLGDAAAAKDRGERTTVIAAQAKLLGSDLAMRVTSDCVTWMGPAGVNPENEMERMMRDAKALQIVEGTNQVQRLVLSRHMAESMAER